MPSQIHLYALCLSAHTLENIGTDQRAQGWQDCKHVVRQISDRKEKRRGMSTYSNCTKSKSTRQLSLNSCCCREAVAETWIMHAQYIMHLVRWGFLQHCSGRLSSWNRGRDGASIGRRSRSFEPFKKNWQNCLIWNGRKGNDDFVLWNGRRWQVLLFALNRFVFTLQLSFITHTYHPYYPSLRFILQPCDECAP